MGGKLLKIGAWQDRKRNRIELESNPTGLNLFTIGYFRIIDLSFKRTLSVAKGADGDKVGISSLATSIATPQEKKGVEVGWRLRNLTWCLNWSLPYTIFRNAILNWPLSVAIIY